MEISKLYDYFLAQPEVCTDTRKITKGCIFFALKGPNFNGNRFAQQALEKGAALAVVDEVEFAQPPNTFLVEDSLKALQQLAQHHRKQFNIPVIGLTGSNGKTTTKELIASVLSKKFETLATLGNLNNHIGVPLTLLRITTKTEIAIIEMGANHIGEIEFLSNLAQPTHGYITNFGKAHIEGFGSEEGVVIGKSELYQYLIKNQGCIFYNGQDKKQADLLESYSNKLNYGSTADFNCTILNIAAEPFVNLDYDNHNIQTQLIGRYNANNCAAALLIGSYFKVSTESMVNALEGYCPTNNRSQIVEKNGHKIILDAYNANPSSMEAALENFDKLIAKNKVVFLGDMFELGAIAEAEHKRIAEMAFSKKINQVYLIGMNFSAAVNSKKAFSDFNAISAYLESNSLPSSTILIKGSRGMALERLVALL
ncbi:UDP-N-acetylmuramoyl-tripeptide--D-alanyl-D-alanine ligase [Sediminicola luteus]|uniref:UDP-N-acetylmuramoyl-tripeptide--D-alanyl-D-alanine ligase n=1 Tax=Sediminicola luteus TaxID=319238 RepID=A0A2A4G9C4_9FLAO|nr:UDP-N-acetylmuramoyl-tripeptide--D-alanyl-D-alanine ligase [Sediminicola luteus]PCE64586.1 UDP-N-acetylmuramoyl-tripeptide--D-alanyl-D-alanine ligase [Sediminicola luteus]